MIGKLHGPGSLFFRENAGTAKGDDGATYELTTSVSGGMPIVRNIRTGRWFTLSWADIINLAKEAGIDKPFAPDGANRVGRQARAEIATKEPRHEDRKKSHRTRR